MNAFRVAQAVITLGALATMAYAARVIYEDWREDRANARSGSTDFADEDYFDDEDYEYEDQ